MARDAEHHAVVKLGASTLGVWANMVGVECLLGEVATASLTLAVSGDEELAGLSRRETAARVRD